MKTTLSKNFFILIFIILIVGLGIFFFIRNQAPIDPVVNPGDEIVPTDTENQITEVGEQIQIDEENISGSYPEIIGESTIAVLAREQIAKFVDEITGQANDQLPELRKDFPDAYNDRKYEFEVQADLLSSDGYESLVLLEYMYTGGANGTSFYVTFNQDNDGQLVSLADIIPASKRVAFVDLVRGKLRNYGGSNGQGLELFAEAVNGISFNQLDRFSVEDQTLRIYFDKYEVGAGASGSISISIPDYQKTVGNLEDTNPQEPAFSWIYESIENDEYPQSIVSLVVDDGSEVPSEYVIETIDGSCNTVSEDSYEHESDDAVLADNSLPILCYFAGFGRVFRVIDNETQYSVQGKDLEEGSPEYTPPETRFETIVNIPKK